MRLLPPLAIPLILCALPSQAITPFGSSCGVQATVLEGYGAPVPGQIVEFFVRDGAANAPHLLMLGFSSTTWNGTPLPWAVPPALGFASSCSLFIAIDVSDVLFTDATGRATLALPLPSTLAGTFYLQTIGLPIGGPWYGTNALDLTVAPSGSNAITGTVRRAGTNQPISGARITLSTPQLSTFLETRSDANGAYSIATPPGNFRLGCAARGFDYVENGLGVPAAGNQDFALQSETHGGQ